MKKINLESFQVELDLSMKWMLFIIKHGTTSWFITGKGSFTLHQHENEFVSRFFHLY